jgi:hypothetical protein
MRSPTPPVELEAFVTDRDLRRGSLNFFAAENARSDRGGAHRVVLLTRRLTGLGELPVVPPEGVLERHILAVRAE